MADLEIPDNPEATSVAPTDKALIWSTAEGVTKWASIARFAGAVLTGAGVIHTNGKTLTILESGTAALRNIVQTITALWTFSNGLRFGLTQSTLDYYQYGAFTPELADATSGGNTPTTPPGVIYGYYVRTGKAVHVWIQFANIDTTGCTSGNTVFIRNLPFTAGADAANRATGAVICTGITYSGYVVAQMTPNTTVCTLQETPSGGTSAGITWSDLADGTARFYFELTYHVD